MSMLSWARNPAEAAAGTTRGAENISMTSSGIAAAWLSDRSGLAKARVEELLNSSDSDETPDSSSSTISGKDSTSSGKDSASPGKDSASPGKDSSESPADSMIPIVAAIATC